MNALGLDSELDTSTIRISHHASLRYLERRGHITATADKLAFAEERLREMLADCRTQRPPIFIGPHGSPSRRYTSGGFAFVVTADHSTLITFYAFGQNRGRDSKERRKAERKRAQREREASWCDDCFGPTSLCQHDRVDVRLSALERVR